MKYQPLHNISSLLKKVPDVFELSALLEFLDEPCILVSSKSYEISAFNKAVLEFTKYSPNELHSAQVENYFPGISSILFELKADSRINCSLINRNGSYTPIQADIKLLSPAKSWYLIFLHDVNTGLGGNTSKPMTNFAIDLLGPLNGISTKQSIKDIILNATNDIGIKSSCLYIKLKREDFEYHKYIGIYSEKYPDYIVNQYPDDHFLGVKNSVSEIALFSDEDTYSTITLPNNNPDGFLIIEFNRSISDTNMEKSKINYLVSIISLALRLDNYSHKIDYLSRQLKNNDNLDTDIINFLNDAIIFTDHRINVINMNSVAETLFGYKSEEAKNINLSKIFNSDLQPIFDRLETRNSITDSVSFDHFLAYNRSGDEIPLFITIVPNLASKNLYDYAFLITDISENETLKEKIGQLEHQANLGDISSIFAHEVLNPVNNISTRLQLMREDISESDPKKAEIEKMLTSCDRITELMNSIKEYSKQTGYKIERLEINPLLSDLINQRTPRLQQANIELQLELGDVPNIKGDKRSLEQAFTNLFSNSIRAMKLQGGGVLGIKTQYGKNMNNERFLDIFISDTGPGIPEEIRENIFKPFFTTHRTGTGLGLALVKKTVSFHKGHISLESFPGGTIFKISMPAA
jgi:PAS domain S-box-containing protein